MPNTPMIIFDIPNKTIYTSTSKYGEIKKVCEKFEAETGNDALEYLLITNELDTKIKYLQNKTLDRDYHIYNL